MSGATTSYDGALTELERIIESANFTGAYRDFTNDLQGFFHAIDWTERWLHLLGAYHLIIWFLVVGLRRSQDAQMLLLFFILGSVYVAEYINVYAGEHWKEFASQNYFDKRGVFISIMYSAPLLCASMFILLNALRSASKLLVAVKRQELKHNARKEKKN